MSSIINKLKPGSHKHDPQEQGQEQQFHTQPHPAVRVPSAPRRRVCADDASSARTTRATSSRRSSAGA